MLYTYPFDVSTYRCIQYKQTPKGLDKLTKRIYTSLCSIDSWRQEPSNPVQDYKPHDVFIPISELDKLHIKIKEKEALLKSTVSEKAYAALQKQLQEKEALLAKAISKSDFEDLQKELKQKHTEISDLRIQIQQIKSRSTKKTPSPKHPKAAPVIPLCSQPIDNLSKDAVKNMLQDKDFFDIYKNKTGKVLKHEYEEIESHGQKLVKDHTTGLTWQQSGSKEYGKYKTAKNYIKKLNNDNYGGYNTWRLPTLEEAMSLMEPEKQGNLYIDAKFDNYQSWIWTADKQSAIRAWVVVFGEGFCGYYNVDFYSVYVRAVC